MKNMYVLFLSGWRRVSSMLSGLSVNCSCLKLNSWGIRCLLLG